METNSPQTVRPSTTGGSILGYIFAFGMIGVILTCLGTYISQLDQLIQWKRFAPPLTGAQEVVEGSSYEVKVRTADGTIYRWGEEDEIWTQSVLYDWATRLSCDDYPAAFNPLTHPPEYPQDCAAFEVGGEIVEEVAYVIDQQGAVWQWDFTTGYSEFRYILCAPFGGFFGILIGIVVWEARKSRARQITNEIPPAPEQAPSIPGEGLATPDERQVTPGEAPAASEYTPDATGEAAALPDVAAAGPAGTRKSSRVWLLPVVLVGILVVIIGVKSMSVSKSPGSRLGPRQTQFMATQNVRWTEEAVWFSSPPATPDPAGPAYDFAVQCPVAQWIEFLDSYQCPGDMQPSMVNIDVIQYIGAGSDAGNQALRVYLPRHKWRVEARYPVWEIRPGDHFRATLVCPPEVEGCRLGYALYFEVHLGSLVPLGEWELTNDQRTLDIDVDLSHFSGQVVSFVLWTLNHTQETVEQTALWANPRIENVPSTGTSLP